MRQIRYKPINFVVAVPATTRFRDANAANTVVSCKYPPYPLHIVSGRYHLNGVIYGFIIHILRKGIYTLQYAAVANPVVAAFSFQ